jgi:hypothetical protein
MPASKPARSGTATLGVMDATCSMPLVLHGAVVLVVSQITGYAFFRALRGAERGDAKAERWRMSHAACSAGAVLLFALAPIVPRLRLAQAASTVLVASLVASTYAFSLGTVVAGVSGQRGLRAGGPSPNVAVYALYLAGALGSTLAALLLLYGAARAYVAEGC